MRRSLHSLSIPLAFATTFVAVYVMTPAQGGAPAGTSPIPDDVYYAGCDEARAAGVAPIYSGQPGYREEMDGDDDGIACEPHRNMY